MHASPVRPVVLLVSAALLAMPRTATAQADSVITADLVTRSLSMSPPFDQGFRLRVAMPKGVDSVSLVYAQASGDTSWHSVKCWDSRHPVKTTRARLIEVTALDFSIDELCPDHQYLFRFTIFVTKPVREADPLKASVGTRDTVIGERVVDSGGHRDTTRYIRPIKQFATRDTVMSEEIDIMATPTAAVAAHFDTDFGVLVTNHNRGPGYIGAGTNVHFYFVPVNGNERTFYWRSFRDQVLKRASIFVGLSFVKLRATEEVKNMFDTGNPVVGIGVRPVGFRKYKPLGSLRLNAGVVWFKQDVANPLVAEDKTKHAPFVSLTGDITLKDLFGPLAALLGVKS